MRVSRHNAVNEVQMQRESNPYSWWDTPIYHHASTYEKSTHRNFVSAFTD